MRQWHFCEVLPGRAGTFDGSSPPAIRRDALIGNLRRDGQREVVERGAAGLARARNGIRRDAIIEQYRSADVWADTPVTCLELPLDSFDDYRRLHSQIAMKIMRNLSGMLARRLILVNAKVDLLSAY